MGNGGEMTKHTTTPAGTIMARLDALTAAYASVVDRVTALEAGQDDAALAAIVGPVALPIEITQILAYLNLAANQAERDEAACRMFGDPDSLRRMKDTLAAWCRDRLSADAERAALLREGAGAYRSLATQQRQRDGRPDGLCLDRAAVLSAAADALDGGAS